MSSLNKLAIRGIRSFDDKHLSVIEFFSPVTVIVGHNGSGKTTIIECLKYATTGDQPPNTRGGAFVHDPKMANEKEVKAQVKLRFRAANGTKMLVVRNLSVSVKKTGLTMKTLESVLGLGDGNLEKGGKRGVISTKCAEMDAEIPQLLGVSKSVLENVIFCHQEDSYWPLAEPSALKKKFDDIFEATRYTKALDAIKALRKDRVTELKAEKERLDSLAREKSMADKLRGRISDLNATIAAKEVELEETRKAYMALADANQKFAENSSKFREMYTKFENLENAKARYQKDLDDLRINMHEIEGTETELQSRLDNFNEYLKSQKEKRRKQTDRKSDLEDELLNARRLHDDLINDQGELAAEAKAQSERISAREDLIREISVKHQLKGFNYSPLEREKIIEFINTLERLQRKQKAEFEKYQAEIRARNDEYNNKSTQLRTEVESLKLQKSSLRQQVNERQRSIAAAESELNGVEMLPGELRTLQADIENKKARLEKIKSDIKSANFDERLTEKSQNAKTLDDKREQLTAEFRTLTMQSDVRIRLGVKTTELKAKISDVTNIIETNKARFRKLVGVDPHADTMEHELDRALQEKDRQIAEVENDANAANKTLQQAEATISNMKTQARDKQEELKNLEKKLKEALSDFSTVEAAIVDATEQLNLVKTDLGSMTGSSEVYERMLKFGKERAICTACNRRMDEHELAVFEKHLKDQIKKTSSDVKARAQEEEDEWTQELSRLQLLLPVEVSRSRIRSMELPALERQIKNQEVLIPAMREKAEEDNDKLAALRKELKEISVMKPHANHVSRMQKDISRLRDEISNSESELSVAGSVRTPDDVQMELDATSAEMRANERDKNTIFSERERQSNLSRSIENDVHAMRLRETETMNKIRDKTALERRVEADKKDLVTYSAKLKDLDAKITDSQTPIEKLESEYQQAQRELTDKVAEAQRASQDLNISVDKLESVNKAIERYVKEKRARRLQECSERLEQSKSEIRELEVTIENIRNAIAEIDKEINESGASMANLRDNIRARKLVQDIKTAQTEMDGLDMEGAAKARRTFNEMFEGEKQKEAEMQRKNAHIGGEVTSLKAQLEQCEDDLREFKDINKRYTDQLVKVKMSDMANNDLEKYAKALDNAIMKYHTLKMEEVNETMRHLWNRTYQGTDIDGIKIRSDVEGGASKRSYNYRVVMTKDQVEMDMRGRCSAGQKMLASIIIRLALSDSFGQNCGILALDEPTNALDTENIDALAASLVDIINERKNHSNFQLIIITHDENFLRKLGQSDVMDYYWRVARDSRQKSTIERQTFR